MSEVIYVPTNGAAGSRRWTKDELSRALALKDAGCNPVLIATELGRSVISVESKFWRKKNVATETGEPHHEAEITATLKKVSEEGLVEKFSRILEAEKWKNSDQKITPQFAVDSLKDLLHFYGNKNRR